MSCGGSDEMWLAEEVGPRTPTMLMLAKEEGLTSGGMNEDDLAPPLQTRSG